MSITGLSGIAGTAIFLSAMQFAIASCEMSSRYSVENFSTSQPVLQNAANALSTFTIIGVVWTIATLLVMYSDYGLRGMIAGLLTNLIFLGWIVLSYIWTIKRTAAKNNLKMPEMFNFDYMSSAVPRSIKNV